MNLLQDRIAKFRSTRRKKEKRSISKRKKVLVKMMEGAKVTEK